MPRARFLPIPDKPDNKQDEDLRRNCERALGVLETDSVVSCELPDSDWVDDALRGYLDGIVPRNGAAAAVWKVYEAQLGVVQTDALEHELLPKLIPRSREVLENCSVYVRDEAAKIREALFELENMLSWREAQEKKARRYEAASSDQGSSEELAEEEEVDETPFFLSKVPKPRHASNPRHREARRKRRESRAAGSKN